MATVYDVYAGFWAELCTTWQAPVPVAEYNPPTVPPAPFVCVPVATKTKLVEEFTVVIVKGLTTLELLRPLSAVCAKMMESPICQFCPVPTTTVMFVVPLVLTTGAFAITQLTAVGVNLAFPEIVVSIPGLRENVTFPVATGTPVVSEMIPL